jgi:hypothetical protein
MALSSQFHVIVRRNITWSIVYFLITSPLPVSSKLFSGTFALEPRLDHSWALRGGRAEGVDLRSVMVAPTQYFIFQSAAKIGMQRNPNITGTTQASRAHWGGHWGKGHTGREGVLLGLEGKALEDNGCNGNKFFIKAPCI